MYFHQHWTILNSVIFNLYIKKYTDFYYTFLFLIVLQDLLLMSSVFSYLREIQITRWLYFINSLQGTWSNSESYWVTLLFCVISNKFCMFLVLLEMEFYIVPHYAIRCDYHCQNLPDMKYLMVKHVIIIVSVRLCRCWLTADWTWASSVARWAKSQ